MNIYRPCTYCDCDATWPEDKPLLCDFHFEAGDSVPCTACLENDAHERGYSARKAQQEQGD